MEPREQTLFWNRFRAQMKVVAFKVCRDESLPLWLEADDFVQEAMVVAVNFVQSKMIADPQTPIRMADVREEAFRYAYTSMRNSFLSHIRQVKNQKRILDENKAVVEDRTLSGARQGTPDSRLVFDELRREVERVASNSTSSDYKKLSAAMAKHSDDTFFDGVTAKEFAASAGVSANTRRDFARMLQSKIDRISK